MGKRILGVFGDWGAGSLLEGHDVWQWQAANVYENEEKILKRTESDQDTKAKGRK